MITIFESMEAFQYWVNKTYTREKHEGWEILNELSKSGKQLFKCKTCGRISYGPDKTCLVKKETD